MTLSECRITLLLRRYDADGTCIPVVRFSTIREFRAFQYELQVDCERDDATRHAQFRIRGVHAPMNIMPSAGAAVCDIELEGAEGEWRIDLVGARQQDGFTVNFECDAIRVVEPLSDGKIEMVIDEEVEIVRL